MISELIDLLKINNNKERHDTYVSQWNRIIGVKYGCVFLTGTFKGGGRLPVYGFVGFCVVRFQ